MIKLFFDNTKNTDLFYMLKLSIHDAFFFVDTGDSQLIYLDKRELGVVSEKNKNISLTVLPLEPLIDSAKVLGGEGSLNFKIAKLVLEPFRSQEILVSNSFPIDLYEFLKNDGFKITSVGLMYSTRQNKTESEVASIRESLIKTQRAYKKIEEILIAAKIDGKKLIYDGKVLTSEYIKNEIERLMLDEGMENSEGMIVSCAAQAAMPHHGGSGELLANESIIVDLFPRSKAAGYFADMTRTYCKGEPSEQLKKMYQVVQKAQEAAIAQIAPGKKTSEIHQICVDIFLAEGFDVGEKGFVHGTGHGLGLDIHEGPYLNLRNAPEILEVGNVVTVEPGLYYLEFGGVRLEDVVVVTEDGCRNLTDYPKSLIIE